MKRVPTPPHPRSPPSSAAPQNRRLKVENALSYVHLVRREYEDRPHVYDEFLDLMKAFRSESVDTAGVIERVSELFEDHPELIVGFNVFLPPSHRIHLQTNDRGTRFRFRGRHVVRR